MYSIRIQQPKKERKKEIRTRKQQQQKQQNKEKREKNTVNYFKNKQVYTTINCKASRQQIINRKPSETHTTAATYHRSTTLP